MSQEWLRSISTHQTAYKIEEDQPIIPNPDHSMAYAFEPIRNYVPAVVPYDAEYVVFKFKSFIVRYKEQHKVRLGTEILKTRQRKHLA